MGNMLFLAASAKAASSTNSGGYTFVLLLIGLVAVMYFVMIRPQRNRSRRAQQMNRDLQVGYRVRTTAGIHGTVTSLEDDDVMLEVAPGVEMRFMRRAVMDVIHNGGQAADEADLDSGMDAGEDGAEAEEDGTGGATFAGNGHSAD